MGQGINVADLGAKNNNKHKQLFGTVPGTGGSQNCLCVPKEWLPEPLGPRFRISKPLIQKPLADFLDECRQHLCALLTQALVLLLRKGLDGKGMSLPCMSRVTHSAFD